jgi:aminoglycoside phosphotransferase (APT) family kinase protein
MHVIFPMAGEGSRFGYKFKPFIKATEETFIEIAKKPFDILNDPTFVFSYRRVQEKDHMVSDILEDLFPSSKIQCCIIEKSDGPFQTLQQTVAKEGLKGPAFFCDCDHAIDIGPMLIPTDAAVIVPTWTIKPDEYPSFGKVKFNKYGHVAAFCEKEVPDLKEGETLKGILGCYFFPDISIVSKYPPYQDVSSFLKDLLAEKKPIVTVDIQRADFFGTPKQLDAYRFTRAQTYTLFLDIDGVLLNQESKIMLANTYAKISHWRSQGHKVFLTTASPNYSSTSLRAKIPHDGFITGISPGPRIVINDKKPYCPFYSMAEGVALERNKGLSEVDLSVFKPTKIAREFDGGSFANTYLLTDNTVRKYITKTPDVSVHVDVLKRQYEDLKRLRFITKDLVPEIFGSRETFSDFYYDMEYLEGYQTLCSFDVSTQNQVLAVMAPRLWNEVYSLRRKVQDPTKWITEYLEKRVFPKLTEFGPVEINGQKYEPLKKTFLDLASSFGPQFESQIHGDLSLENIMWNPETRDVKLIDCAGSSYLDTVSLDLGKIFQTMVGGYKSWDGEVTFLGPGRYSMAIPASIELSAEWLDLWGPRAYETGLYYMAIHFIRFLPFMRKKSEGFALQAWLLAHVFLNKIHL